VSNDPCILAVDLGTSGCKTALVTTRGHVLGWEFAPVTTHYFPGGGAEQAPADWWSALIATTRRLLADNFVPRERIVAVCCTTQGEGTVPVDAEGRALMNAILWMDARGAKYLPDITGAFPKVGGFNALKLLRWVRLTGGAPSQTGKDPAGHMLLIKHEHPGVYRATHKFLNVLDYLNLRLTGRFVATFDSIITSWVTDNRNAGRILYSDALLRGCGIDRAKFPDLVPCTEVLGPITREFADAVGLPTSVKVVAGAIDNTAAAVGSGAVEDYAAHLYIGTSSWLAAHVPFKKTDIAASMASLPCAVPGRYLLTALQATAGGNLTFLRDKILYHKDELLQEAQTPDVYKIMDRIADRVPAGSNGVLYTPWIFGERAPVEDRTVRAGLFNLSLENSREDIIRAVMEGVAFNTRWLLIPFERFTKRHTDVINIVGGGAISNVWCGIFADVLGRQVRQTKDPIQANARGAAFIAAAGLGLTGFGEIPKCVEYQKTYTPNPDHRAIYDKLFAEFVAIYRKTKAIYRRLTRLL
jgi:xylulokinase